MNAKSFLDWVAKALFISMVQMSFFMMVVFARDSFLVDPAIHQLDKNYQGVTAFYDSSNTFLCNVDFLIDNIFLTLQSSSMTSKKCCLYTEKLIRSLESVKTIVDKKILSPENFLLIGHIVKNSSHAISALLPREKGLCLTSSSLVTLIDKVCAILLVMCDGSHVHQKNLLASAETVLSVAMGMGDLVRDANVSKQLLVPLIQHAGTLAQIINRIVLATDATEEIYAAACSSGNAIARFIALTAENSAASEENFYACTETLAYLFDAIKVIVHKPDVNSETHALISGVLNNIGIALSLLAQNSNLQAVTVDKIAVLLSRTIHFLNEINNEEIVSIECLTTTAKAGYVLAQGLNAIASKAHVAAATLEAVCADAELLAQLMNAVGGDFLADAEVQGAVCRVAENLAGCVVSLAKNSAISTDQLSQSIMVLSAVLGSIKVISSDQSATVQNLSSAAQGARHVANALLVLADHKNLSEVVIEKFGTVLANALNSVLLLGNHKEEPQEKLQATVMAAHVLMQSVGKVASYCGDGSRKLLLVLGMEIEQLIDRLMLIALDAKQPLQELLCLTSGEALLALASIMENTDLDDAVLVKQGITTIMKVLSLSDILVTKAIESEPIESVAGMIKNSSIPLARIVDHARVSVESFGAVQDCLSKAFSVVNKMIKHTANNATSLFFIVGSLEALVQVLRSIVCHDRYPVEDTKKKLETMRLITKLLKEIREYPVFSDGSLKVLCETMATVVSSIRGFAGIESLEAPLLDDCNAILAEVLNEINGIIHKGTISPVTMYNAQVVLDEIGLAVAVIAARKEVHDTALLKSTEALVFSAQIVHQLCNYALLDSSLVKKAMQDTNSFILAAQDIAKKNTPNGTVRKQLLQVILFCARTINDFSNKCVALRIKQEDLSLCCKQLVELLQMLAIGLSLPEDKSVYALSLYVMTDFLENSFSRPKVNEYRFIALTLKKMIDSLVVSWGIVAAMDDYKDSVDDCIKQNGINDSPNSHKKTVVAIRNYAYSFLQQYENFFERWYRYYSLGF